MESPLSPPLRDRFDTAVKQLTSISKDIEDGLKVLADKEKRWTDILATMDKHAENAKNKIVLDIGGTRFATSKATLLSINDTFFHAMLSSGRWHPDPDGSYFIDRSPKYFGYVLDFLRNGQLDLSSVRPDKIAKIQIELDFYQIRTNSVPVQPPFKSIGSTLLSTDQQKMIMSWLGDNKSCDLVYQSSRDGLNPDTFHRLCDDKGPSVTVYQARGYLFGGYTQVSWNCGGGTVRDPNAFLFTLTNPHGLPPTKYPAKHRGMPVFLHGRCLPILGTYMAISPLPNYQVRIVLHAFPGDVVDTSGKGCYVFTGLEEFNVEEVEVFVVK